MMEMDLPCTQRARFRFLQLEPFTSQDGMEQLGTQSQLLAADTRLRLAMMEPGQLCFASLQSEK
jgi:hypothetical protein